MSEQNTFTHGPLGQIFLKTALPIILVMSMNGLLTVVDAMFLGRYVGADALGAVTLIFPLFMLIIALATLVANGMSSILARNLGAGDMAAAHGTFAGAHGLALAVSALLIVAYLLVGAPLVAALASGDAVLAEMARTYLVIMVFMSPLAFLLGVHSDALRNEGRIGFMAAMSLLVSLSNIGFNYVLIALAGMGVAGSALGTAAAQLLALLIILGYRLQGRAVLHPRALLETGWLQRWGRILALGAPQSLNFIGIALGATSVIIALQMISAPDYDAKVSAYGIVTRVMTFMFLPLLGLTHALQSIVGNNYGAQLWARSDTTLRMGLVVALIYCTGMQALFWLFPAPIAGVFVTEPDVVASFVPIMQISVAMLWLAGPLIVIASYFQAIGKATQAAVLGLAKPYAFGIPLTFVLALSIGENGIWLAGPVAEVLMGLVTLIVLRLSARGLQLRHGLFAAPA